MTPTDRLFLDQRSYVETNQGRGGGQGKTPFIREKDEDSGRLYMGYV